VRLTLNGVVGSLVWDRLVVLLAAALIVLGPERLPGAIVGVTRTLRQFRDQLHSAAQQAKETFDPKLGEPLATLAEVRSDLRDLTAHVLADPPPPTPRTAPPRAYPPIDPQAT
jgi:Sec-independent protein translocase protein TatA